METIFTAYEAISFTESHIRQLHHDLLAHSTKDERHRGACKNLSNNVEAFNEEGESLALFSKRHRRSTRRRMEELLAWLDEQGREKRPHPLLVVAIFVVVFLEIHPFQDGNGRLSRILTTLMLLRAGYAYVPYSSLESIVEHSKESYYISLWRTQGTIRNPEPDWNPWIEFFLEPCIGRRPDLRRKWSASASSSRTCGNYPSHCLNWRASMANYGRGGCQDLRCEPLHYQGSPQGTRRSRAPRPPRCGPRCLVRSFLIEHISGKSHWVSLLSRSEPSTRTYLSLSD